MRVFVPRLVGSPSHACGIEDGFPACDSDGEDVVLEPEKLALCLATAQYEMNRRRDLDNSFVRRESCLISPSLDAPRDTLPALKLRDRMLSDNKWIPRKKMFEVANRTPNVLTISVVPKNPELFQCWYQRRIVVPLNAPTEPYKYECQTTQEKESKDAPPTRQLGFLKPFETYSSADYGADCQIQFEQDWIGYPAQIRDIVDPIEDPVLKRNLHAILWYFYLDLEAQSVGLVYHIGKQGFAKVFHKTF